MIAIHDVLSWYIWKFSTTLGIILALIVGIGQNGRRMTPFRAGSWNYS